MEEPGQFVPGDQHVMEGQLLLRMLRAAGAQLGTWAVGVGSQQPVKTHLKLDMTFLNCSISGRGGPWGWKVLLSVKQSCTGGSFPRKAAFWGEKHGT